MGRLGNMSMGIELLQTIQVLFDVTIVLDDLRYLDSAGIVGFRYCEGFDGGRGAFLVGMRYDGHPSRTGVGGDGEVGGVGKVCRYASASFSAKKASPLKHGGEFVGVSSN